MTRRALGVLTAVALAGCTVGPRYQAPKILAGDPPVKAFLSSQETLYRSDQLPSNWWRLYDDPVLDGLVEKALTRNTDLRVALASLQQAEAQLRVAQRERTPQTMLTVDPEYGQASGDSSGSPTALKPGAVYDAMAGVSYDLDLFGRLRRSIELAQADLGAAQAALDLARVNVAGATAAAYASVCSAGLQIAVATRSIAIARQSLDVTQRRFNAGVAGINDIVQARALLRQTQATLPTFITDQRTALYTLATLTGDTPETSQGQIATCMKPPILRQVLPVGSGAALLARRPDVRQAERKLAAAVASIGVSTADLYPSISLAGGLGTTATNLPDIVSNRAFHWNVGPLVTWNIPNLSVARAQIAASNAQARGALATFDGTVLTALRETESSMTTLARELDTEQALSLARDDAATAQGNIERLYKGGIGDFLSTLDAERTLIQAEASLASTTAQVSQDQVSLFMALGGGWENSPPVKDVSLDDVAVKNR